MLWPFLRLIPKGQGRCRSHCPRVQYGVTIGEAMEPSAADNSLPRDEAEWRRRIFDGSDGAVCLLLSRPNHRRT